MKLFSTILTFSMLSFHALESAAFVPNGPQTPSLTSLNSMRQSLPPGFFELFPDELQPNDHIEGGGTVRTYSIPPWATRIQYIFSSRGRPMRGEANLWLGPLRKTHTLKFDTENGAVLPIQGTLKFKKGPPQLKVSTSSDPNCPLDFGMYVPMPDRAIELNDNTERIHYGATADQKQKIQGSGTDGKNGMWVYWHIPQEVKSIQVVGWSIDTGRKSFKVDMEILKGPNNPMQKMFLQCGGGSQPYHAVYQTPGAGWTLRIRNKKFVEDGLVQFTVIPYEYEDSPYGQTAKGNGVWDTWDLL